jgi:cytochrome c-type biogenesis protein
MTDGWVEYLTGPWGFVFAFAAGVLSFLSPCVLPLVPAYLAHMTGTAAVSAEDGVVERRETVTHAVIFVLGFTLVFTFIGASVGLLGALFSDDSSYWVRDRLPLLERIAGVVLIVMGLNLIGVIRIPWLYRTYSMESLSSPQPRPQQVALAASGGTGGSASVAMSVSASEGAPALRYANSGAIGAAFAVGWTPCIGPVLGAILTLSATTGDVLRGASLLLVYSLGLGLPFIITGLAVVPVSRFLRGHHSILPIVEIVMGTMVIFVGMLIFLDELTIFNRYFDFFGLSEI